MQSKLFIICHKLACRNLRNQNNTNFLVKSLPAGTSRTHKLHHNYSCIQLEVPLTTVCIFFFVVVFHGYLSGRSVEITVPTQYCAIEPYSSIMHIIYTQNCPQFTIYGKRLPFKKSDFMIVCAVHCPSYI